MDPKPFCARIHLLAITSHFLSPVSLTDYDYSYLLNLPNSFLTPRALILIALRWSGGGFDNELQFFTSKYEKTSLSLNIVIIMQTIISVLTKYLRRLNI